jgi:hypothetical protein
MQAGVVPNRKMFACRMTNQAMVDLDRLVAALQKRSPVGRASQADAIAFALARAVVEFDEEEEEDKRTRQAAEKASRSAFWKEHRAQVKRDRLAKEPRMIDVAVTVIESEPLPPRKVAVTYLEPDPPTPIEALFPTKEGE